MTRFEFENACHQLGLVVVKEFDDYDWLTVTKDGLNVADVSMNEVGKFTTCFVEFDKLDDNIKKKLVRLLAEYSIRKLEGE